MATSVTVGYLIMKRINDHAREIFDVIVKVTDGKCEKCEYDTWGISHESCLSLKDTREVIARLGNAIHSVRRYQFWLRRCLRDPQHLQKRPLPIGPLLLPSPTREGRRAPPAMT